MKRVLCWASGVLMAFASAAHAELRDVRIWASPDATRVVFDLEHAVQHRVFTLENPHRVVVDIEGLGEDSVRVANRASGQGMVEGIRSAARDRSTVRVVLDVAHALTPRSFALAPNSQYGHRVVLDLDRPAAASATVERASKPSVLLGEKMITVAIDAGHGGEDPGAIGPTGLREKDVALAMARRLAALVNAEPGMRAVLTRTGDYTVALRRRVEIARQYDADLFVSVHANAFRDRNLRGGSVYVLSNRGASSEHARWLAQKENSADMVGGIEIADKDNVLASVLIDLSQSASLEASFNLGERILSSLGGINRLQRSTVQQAGFMVLKAPDIPSVLVETAFISNAVEEKMLRDTAYQGRYAAAIMDGIRGYFEHYRPQTPVIQSADAGMRLRDTP